MLSRHVSKHVEDYMRNNLTISNLNLIDVHVYALCNMLVSYIIVFDNTVKYNISICKLIKVMYNPIHLHF